MKKYSYIKKYIQITDAIKHLKEYARSFKKGNHWVSGVGIFKYCDHDDDRFFTSDTDPCVYYIHYEINLDSSTDTFNWDQIKCYRDIIANLDNLYKEIRTNDKYRSSKFILWQIDISEPGMKDYDADLCISFENTSFVAYVKDLHIIRIEGNRL
jgi:hypothetical protein